MNAACNGANRFRMGRVTVLMMLACLLKGDDERGWRLMPAVVVVTDVVSVGKHERSNGTKVFVGDGF